jgi:hypothetical protein
MSQAHRALVLHQEQAIWHCGAPEGGRARPVAAPQHKSEIRREKTATFAGL